MNHSFIINHIITHRAVLSLNQIQLANAVYALINEHCLQEQDETILGYQRQKTRMEKTVI